MPTTKRRVDLARVSDPEGAGGSPPATPSGILDEMPDEMPDEIRRKLPTMWWTSCWRGLGPRRRWSARAACCRS